MYPILFRIGDFEVTSFGLMMFLSFLSAAWLTGKQLQRYGLPRDLAWDLLAWVAIGGPWLFVFLARLAVLPRRDLPLSIAGEPVHD